MFNTHLRGLSLFGWTGSAGLREQHCSVTQAQVVCGVWQREMLAICVEDACCETGRAGEGKEGCDSESRQNGPRDKEGIRRQRAQHFVSVKG